MHLPTTVTLLLSLHTLSCHAASMYQPDTIVRAASLLNVTGDSATSPSLSDFVPQQYPRPAQIEYLINDYTVRIGVDAKTAKPDSGTLSPDVVSEAVAKIAVWAPNQPGYPKGSLKYPTKIDYQDSIGNQKFSIQMEGYRLDLDNTLVQVGIEGLRRYAVMSRSDKLTDTLFIQIFDDYSFSVFGQLNFEPAPKLGTTS